MPGGPATFPRSRLARIAAAGLLCAVVVFVSAVEFANMSSNRYTAYLNRPKQPSFWEKLALGGVQAAGQIGGGLASAGML